MKTLKQAQQKTETEIAIDNALETFGVVFSIRHVGISYNYKTEQDQWRVDFQRGTVIESFDFFTGIGHRVLPDSHALNALRRENSAYARNKIKERARPFAPYAASVLYCLLIDAEALNLSFNDWADNFGYDRDSMKAFNTYQLCCKIGEQLRRIFTSEQRAQLSELLQDY